MQSLPIVIFVALVFTATMVAASVLKRIFDPDSYAPNSILSGTVILLNIIVFISLSLAFKLVLKFRILM